MFQSNANRNPMPNRNPTAAGITLHLPLSASISIAGMSNDHTDAATITPEAKPNSDFCTRADISSFIKKTNAEPSIVPSSGISSPITNVVVIVSKGITFYRIAKYSNLMKCKKEAKVLPLITVQVPTCIERATQ